MRFGVIGTGSVGQIRVKALKNAEGCELVALADVVVERARCVASSNGIEIFDDYQEMLASNRVDAVIVSTPPQLHEEMVVSALDAGKHVLCENLSPTRWMHAGAWSKPPGRLGRPWLPDLINGISRRSSL